MKITLYVLTFLCLWTNLSVAQTTQNQLENSLECKENNFASEKIYVHTDRTFYQPGEELWYKIYKTGIALQNLGGISEVVHVHLLHPNGSVLQKHLLKPDNQGFSGNFNLSKNYAGGIYKIKAFTVWQQNFGTDAFFEKEITIQKSVLPKLLMKLDFEKEGYGKGDKVAAILTVRNMQDQVLSNKEISGTIRIANQSPIKINSTTDNLGESILFFDLPKDLNTADVLLNLMVQHEGFSESIARKVPITLENIDLQFFPEGGDLVRGFEQKIAFKALNEFGEPTDVAGIILNENGQEVAAFESLHDGMGFFKIFTGNKEKLRAKITQPKGISTIYKLPEKVSKNISATIQSRDKGKMVLNISSKKKQSVLVAIRMQEKVVFTKKIDLQNSDNQLVINNFELPVGICQITIFDEKNLPQWERLAFVNQHRELKIDIEPFKKSYLPREKVELNISVRDVVGNGIPGNFSLAVVDDKLHSFADDKQPNIFAQLLLQSDLRGEIHEPNFYFDKKEEKAPEALDLVMLTNGWRNFEWEEILENTANDWQKKIAYQAENLAIHGRVYAEGQEVEGAKVWLANEKEFVKTDKHGRFKITGENIKLPSQIFAKYKGFQMQGYVNAMSVIPFNSVPLAEKKEGKSLTFNEFFEEKEATIEILAVEEEVEKGFDKMMLADRFYMTDESLSLSEVVVTGYGVAHKKTFAGALNGKVSGIKVENWAHDFDMAADMEAPQEYLYLQLNHHYQNQFHQARQFYVPKYKSQKVETRTDFRKTIYWNPNVITDENGKARLSFFASDEITTFRCILEGIANLQENNQQMVGRKEATFSVNRPFSLQVKMPETVTFGDEIELPIIFKNNTLGVIEGELKLTGLPAAFIGLNDFQNEKINIPANDFIRKKVKFKIGQKVGEFPIRIQLLSQGLEDAIEQKITIAPKGFPQHVSIASNESQVKRSFKITDPVGGSLRATFTAFPDLTAEMMSGVESMLHQPGGCFEQTSSTSYPNALVLQYLENAQKDGMQIVAPEIRKKAFNYLEYGYKRLMGFECDGGGFALFGGGQGEPLLTAYGLLQFNDLRKVWQGVDEKMMRRTEQWLFKKMNERNFTGSVDDAYLLYALTESVYHLFVDKVDIINETTSNSNESYLLALACLININLKKEEIANQHLDKLIKIYQQNKFSHPTTPPSLSHSMGRARALEVTAMTARALMKLRGNANPLSEMINDLAEARLNGGRFGPTQTTIQALKTMTAYASLLSTTKSGGTIQLTVNEEVITSQKYEKGHRGVIEIPDLGNYFETGKNVVKIEFLKTENPLPFVLDVNWETLSPPSSKNKILEMKTELASENAKVGDLVRLTANIENTSEKSVHAPMAIIGIPAGLSLQAWQLKDLQKQAEFDFYEIQGSHLVLYYTEFAPAEKRTVSIDLKADIPGVFAAPASVTYPYYFEEAKCWEKGEKIEILN